MKNGVLLIIFLVNAVVFSQEKLLKQTTTSAKEIELVTYGLDDVVIENSLNNKVEVILLDENPNTHTIVLKEENDVLKIAFKLHFNSVNPTVFRKYITKRLQRASAIIKVPKNKSITLYGKVIGVRSKSFKGALKVFIDKGNLQLDNVQKNASVSLFLGNVYAKVSNKFNLDLITNKGTITVDKQKHQSPFYKKNKSTALYNFKVHSINANVILNTK